jgi:hypothetical protein
MFVKWIRRSRARLSLIYCQARQQILNLMVCLVGQSTVHPITSTHSLTIFSKLNTSNRNFHYSPCLNWWTCGCQSVFCWATDRQLTGNLLCPSIYVEICLSGNWQKHFSSQISRICLQKPCSTVKYWHYMHKERMSRTAIRNCYLWMLIVTF